MAAEERLNGEETPALTSGEDIPDSSEAGMGFLEHLEEMRRRILWAAVGVLVGSLISSVFINEIVELILLKPANDAKLELQNLRTFGQPILYFKLIFISGITLSFPFTLLQVWKFVGPGLYSHEKRWARRITWYTSICFFFGVAFAYFVLIPTMLAFVVGFGSDLIPNQIDVNEYLSTISTLILSAGLVFELPMISYVLSRFGLLRPEYMRKYRRHAIVVILILAAILTPTPDPFNQLLLGVPIWLLYELSIIISKLAAKQANNTAT